MKREFLEGLGLPKEQVDAIMAENGNDINKAKAESEALTTQVAEYKAQLAVRDKDIEELSKQTGNSAELTAKMAELQTKYDTETEALNAKVAEMARNSAIEVALTKAGAKNIKAVKALLDIDKVEVTDEGVKGLEEQLTAMKASDGYLFGEGETTPQFSAFGNPTGAGTNAITIDAFDAMSYSERAKLAQEQPDVFKNITGGI